MDSATEQAPAAVKEQSPQPQSPQKQDVENKKFNSAYVLVGLVVVLLMVAGGAFAYTTFLSSKTALPNNAGLNSYYNQKQVQKKVENSAITDTSDTQINKDLNTIDSNLNNLDSGAAAVDQGFNDQAVNLQ